MVNDNFFDTSALVKYYRLEAGSNRVSQIVAAADNTIYISELAVVEHTSAYWQLYRMGKLDEATARAALAQFSADIGKRFVVVGFQSAWVERAKSLVLQYDLRTLDSLQLAAALSLMPLSPTFVCADARLVRAAAAVGLTVIDPVS